MVQTFSQLQRVDQGRALPVLHFQLVKVVAAEHKGGHARVARFEADAFKIAAAGQQVGAFKQVGLFDGTLHGRFTSFHCGFLILIGRFCKNEKGIEGFAPSSADFSGVINRVPPKTMRLLTPFFIENPYITLN
jgi:hypothetical protein